MGLLNLVTGKRGDLGYKPVWLFTQWQVPGGVSENKDKGAVLLLKNLSDGTTRTIGNVTEYAFNKKSDQFAYIVESANSAGNSVELFNLTNNALKILASDTSKFNKLTWQKEGDGLAFYRSYRKDGYEEDNAVVYTYINIYKSPSLRIFDPGTAKGFPDSMRIYNGSGLTLSDDLTTVFFGIKKWTYNSLAKKRIKRPEIVLQKKILYELIQPGPWQKKVTPISYPLLTYGIGKIPKFNRGSG